MDSVPSIGKGLFGRVLRVIGAGEHFGELALMYNAPRSATVVARTDSVIWAVDRFSFRRIQTAVCTQKINQYIRFLRKVELLAPLAEYERHKIAEALQENIYTPGEVICQEGDRGEEMFIVALGTVVITKKGADGRVVEVQRMGPGQYFGEVALMGNEVRIATAAAASDTKDSVWLLHLEKAAFDQLLGPLKDIMTQKMLQYPVVQAEGPEALGMSYKPNQQPKPSRPPREEDVLEIEQLVSIGSMGKGGYGRVELVRCTALPGPPRYYALKCVSKDLVGNVHQQGHVLSEKRTFELMDHPFVATLFKTFKTEDYLFFLMEAVMGGDLFELYARKSDIPVEWTVFYTACTVLAIDYIHSHNIIFRDLKLENILLGTDGYIRVTDFGLAKLLSDGCCRTYTLCGTPMYLAPEVVTGTGHGKGVDWWALGIMVFTMLASYSPFERRDVMKMYKAITTNRVRYPVNFSQGTIDFISSLLVSSPTKRLGVGVTGANAIKAHSWFSHIDWDKLVRKELPAPYVPTVKGTEDLSNFEEDNDTFDIQAYMATANPASEYSWDRDF